MHFSDFFFSTFQNEMSNVCPRARHFALKSRLLRSRYIFRPAQGQPANFFFRPQRLPGGVHRQESHFWGRSFGAGGPLPAIVNMNCVTGTFPEAENSRRGLGSHRERKRRAPKTSFLINSIRKSRVRTSRFIFRNLQAETSSKNASGAQKARF